MDPLKTACYEKDLSICNVLEKLDGWSIGVEIIIDEEQYSPYVYGACFEENSICVMFNPSIAY